MVLAPVLYGANNITYNIRMRRGRTRWNTTLFACGGVAVHESHQQGVAGTAITLHAHQNAHVSPLVSRPL